MTTTITLDKQVTLVPAQEVITTNTFVVTYIEENYGVFLNQDNEDNPGRFRPERGRPASVIADIEIGSEPGPVIRRSIIVWEGDDYLAVRNNWTDQDLFNKIKEILEAE